MRVTRFIGLKFLSLGLIAALFAFAASGVSAPTDKPDTKDTQQGKDTKKRKKPAEKLTIKKIMIEVHKKPTELLKKVAMGKADAKQKKRLLELYQAMAKMKPPKGDAKSWKEKTTLLITASKRPPRGKRTPANCCSRPASCKNCHDLHKPTKK